MVRQGRGVIINISSKAGKVGLAGMGPYVASKFAVEGLTATLAAEGRPLGIRVNSISNPNLTPCLTLTPILTVTLARHPGLTLSLTLT